MNILILSQEKTLFEGEAAGFNAKTRVGEITILDHHQPLTSILERGIGKIIKKDGTREELEITGGFLEMNKKNELRVLVD